MKPRAFKIINGTEYFIYDRKQLGSWREQGHLSGDVGMLLFSRNGNTVKYKGFGTIENPHKSMMVLSLIHLPLFDGVWQKPEDMVMSKYKEDKYWLDYWEKEKGSYRLVFLNNE